LRRVGEARFENVTAELLGQVRHRVEKIVVRAGEAAVNSDPHRRSEKRALMLVDPGDRFAYVALLGELSHREVPGFGVIKNQ
jgi:hypothetical protein